MRPLLNNATRSHTLCTRSSKCEDSSTDTPSLLKPRMMSSSSAVACGSSPEVGSSRMAICAPFIRISASPRRWRMPRENVPTRLSANSASPTCVERVGDPLLAFARS